MLSSRRVCTHNTTRLTAQEAQSPKKRSLPIPETNLLQRTLSKCLLEGVRAKTDNLERCQALHNTGSQPAYLWFSLHKTSCLQPLLTFLSPEGPEKVKCALYKQYRTARTGCDPASEPDLRPQAGLCARNPSDFTWFQVLLSGAAAV